MRNHFHLGVQTPEPNLSEGIKWLQGRWVARYNRYRGEIGRPVQGGTRPWRLSQGIRWRKSRTTFTSNPVRAKIVPIERLAEYRWSSLPWFVRKDRPEFLKPEVVLASCGGLADSRGGWRKYVENLNVLTEEDVQRRGEEFGRMSHGWVIGSPAFRLELKRKLMAQIANETPALLGADTEAQREAREQIWEQRLARAAKLLAVRPRWAAHRQIGAG